MSGQETKEARTKWIKVRVSESERAEIEQKAILANVSIAELIRSSLRRVKTWTIKDKETEREKIREISRIGQNLNQIARFCHLHKSDADTAQIISALLKIEKTLDLTDSFFLPPHSRDSVNTELKGDKDAH